MLNSLFFSDTHERTRFLFCFYNETILKTKEHSSRSPKKSNELTSVEKRAPRGLNFEKRKEWFRIFFFDAAHTFPTSSPLPLKNKQQQKKQKCAMVNQLLGPIPAWGSLTLVGSAGFLLGAVVAALISRCLSGRAAAASAATAASPHRALAAAEAGTRTSPPHTSAWGTGKATTASAAAVPVAVGASTPAASASSSWPAAARVAGGAGAGKPHPALAISSPSEGNTYNNTTSSAGGGAGAAAASSSSSTAVVRDAYELDELDDEWRALVQEVDDRLVAARAPKCGPAERASVVQALLASAPDESAEDALDRAARLVRAARRGGAAVASGFA